MPEITLTVPYAVITADVLKTIRAVVEPYTLWPQFETLAIDPDEIEANADSIWDRAYVLELHARAQEKVDAGGFLALAELSVVGRDYTEHRWAGDERAPIELVDTCVSGQVRFTNDDANLELALAFDSRQTVLRVNTNMHAWMSPTPDRGGYEVSTIADAVRDVLLRHVDEAQLNQELGPFKVFIGHGGDTKWEVIRDFIDADGYDTTYFEDDDRIGRSTYEVVEQMISEASVSVIVMTGVDVLADGTRLARQNVIHELGFSHGRLGQRNTLILLEDGTDEPSNIAGVTQIRFPHGDANRTKVELLAALANRKRDHEAAAH